MSDRQKPSEISREERIAIAESAKLPNFSNEFLFQIQSPSNKVVYGILNMTWNSPGNGTLYIPVTGMLDGKRYNYYKFNLAELNQLRINNGKETDLGLNIGQRWGRENDRVRFSNSSSGRHNFQFVLSRDLDDNNRFRHVHEKFMAENAINWSESVMQKLGEGWKIEPVSFSSVFGEIEL